MSIRTKNLINKTFANQAEATVFFSERNSFGKAFQFIYKLETEPDNVYYIDEVTEEAILLNAGGGGGSSTPFPNGREIITASRDFQQSDEGKVLIVVGNDITLTMPDASIWTEAGIPIGLKFLKGYTGCSYEATHGFPTKVLQLSSDGEFITVITGEYLGKSSVGTIANMQVDSDDDGIVTLNKYLYDKVQNTIQLTGTEVDKPVTGDIEFEQNESLVLKTLNSNGDDYNSIIFDAGGVMITSKISPTTSSSIQINDNEGKCLLLTDNTNPVGYSCSVDCTPYISDLDYAQKKYVDTHIAFTTVPSSSTDTGVKGQMAVDATYLYICVATDTWTRVALAW